MKIFEHLAKHIHDVFYGKNWTWSNLKDTLEGVTWQEATHKIGEHNTIATLTHHSAYYVYAQIEALTKGTLSSKDAESFTHPPIHNEEDWQAMQANIFNEVNKLIELVKQLPDEKMNEFFIEEKYGTQYRNIAGLIEHTHYHLGQIALLKKLMRG